jgi:hypothetical protein
MPLEQSVVFRQLEQGSRFSRFDYTDACLLFLPFNIHYLVALIAGWSLGPPWITLVATGVAIWFFRMRFPEGLGPLLHVLSTPHHLSALAHDVMVREYPGRKRGSP